MTQITVPAVVFFLLASQASPQDPTAAGLARQVKADLAAIASHPTVAGWQRSHTHESFQLAHCESETEDYGIDYARLNRWCAASVSGSASPIKRAALFYTPSVRTGALPTLPDKNQISIKDTCQLQALWYSTQAGISVDAVARELSSSWGKPNGTFAEPNIAGCGLWKSVVAWHRGGMSIWVAVDSFVNASWKKQGGNTAPATIIYARSDLARHYDNMTESFASSAANPVSIAKRAAEIAGEEPALTRQFLSGSSCNGSPQPLENKPLSAARLKMWLFASRKLPPERRAAALLLADLYVNCAQLSSDAKELNKSWKRLGARFIPACGGTEEFAHNFREQAEETDPNGKVGELAGLVSLGDVCSLRGRREWPDLVIEKGERMLARFPGDDWTPYIRYALARAHAAKLSFAYPNNGPEGTAIRLTHSAMSRERDAATEQFKAFIKSKPDAPESVSAWQEGWRLLAGLPPSKMRFGCGCE